MVSAAIASRMPRANSRSPDVDDDGEFFVIKDVPVFAEHQTTAKNGRYLVFGYNELLAVCNRCNQRINDTGDYAAITLGHTPDPALLAAGRAKAPKIVGYAGPFRMGVMGSDRASRRYAILAEFRIFKTDWEEVRRHPRRSPELWLEESYEKMFLDPIALLGAEAPRLDMGLLYSASRHTNGRTCLVEKYSAVAPAAGNVFVPSTKYGADQSPQQSGESSSMLTQDDLAQIVQAIQQTDVWQWCQQQMTADTGPKPSPDQPGGPDLSSVPPVTPAGPPGGDPMSATLPGAAPGMPPGAPPPAPPGPGMPPQAAGGQPPPADRKKEESNMAGMRSAYAAGADDAEADDDDDDDDAEIHVDIDSHNDDKGKKEKYAKTSAAGYSVGQLVEAVKTLQKQLKATQTQLDEERSHRIDAERYNKLQGMQSEGVMLDLNKEMGRLCYSKMNDQQFNDAVEFISEHAQRLPTNLLIPTFDQPPRESVTGRERYSKEQSDRALKIAEQKAIAGESVTYESILSQVAAGKL